MVKIKIIYIKQQQQKRDINYLLLNVICYILHTTVLKESFIDSCE